MIIGRLLHALAAAALAGQPLLAQSALAQAEAQKASASPAAPTSATPPAPPATDPDGDADTYTPQDKDERGLWMQMDEAERKLKTSPMVIRDPALNAYVRSVLCRLVGERKCSRVRIYIVRTAAFNASMGPSGVMEIWSGLLLRTRNEAQLAAVIGHEYTHYEKRHTLKLFRDIRSKSASAVWLSFTGIGLIASLGLMADIFRFSREMEHEADVGSLALMARAGYDTREAAHIWENLREEMDATAAARQVKSKKEKDQGMFATHPPTAERVTYLTAGAKETPGVPGNTGAAPFAQLMQHHWPSFIDDQFKQNDFGASEYLVGQLAADGSADWIRYAHGELYRRRAADGDLVRAIQFYGEGIAAGGTLPELWRGRGLAELKAGQADAGRADLNEYIKRAPDASDKAMIAMMAGE